MKDIETNETNETNETEDRGKLDLSFIIDQHKREVWDWKQKEAEWVRTQNQLEGTKRIVEELSSQLTTLKKELDRLAEENNNLLTIDSSHQDLNGELRRDNIRLAKQVEDYRDILKKAGL